MKTKFDDNVAQEIPKTKEFAEPELPWKLSSAEITDIGSNDENLKAAITSAGPMNVRAVFVVLLVAAIFVVIMNSIVNIAIDNNNMQLGIASSQRQAEAAKVELEKAIDEKTTLSESTEKLERRVNDLSAQKELYTAVIETLTKKTDEPQAGSN